MQSYHTMAGIGGLASSEQARRVNCLDEQEEVGDGRAEGSSAIGDGGPAAVLPTLMFASLEIHDLKVRR